MLEDNPFFLARAQGVGCISRELAEDVGISGPLLRGSGVEFDLRGRRSVLVVRGLPVHGAGGDRRRLLRAYRVRMVEFRESIKIVRQALDKLPEGPISSRPG